MPAAFLEEEKVEKFWGSVEMMLFVYALAAVVSYAMAGIIRLIFAAIRMRQAKPQAEGAEPEAKA